MIGYIIFTCVILIVFDIIWFSWSLPNIYEPTIIKIQRMPITLKIMGGLISWFLIAFGINYFVVIKENKILSAIRGLLFGFIVYGVYNSTNYAIFNNYSISTSIIDTLWGTFIVGFVSAIIS